MYVKNITDDYDSFANCLANENEEKTIIVKYSLLSIPGSVLLLSLIHLIVSAIPKF